MAIIGHLSDKKLSYNSVEITQKSCFLMVIGIKLAVESRVAN